MKGITRARLLPGRHQRLFPSITYRHATYLIIASRAKTYAWVSDGHTRGPRPVARTLEQQPPKIIDTIKTIVTQVGRVAYVAAARRPDQLAALPPRLSLPVAASWDLYCRLWPFGRPGKALPLLRLERASPLSIFWGRGNWLATC